MSESSPEPLDFARLLRESQRDLGPVFAARFDGYHPCECGDLILEGDEVRYEAGELKHADCVTELVPDD